MLLTTGAFHSNPDRVRRQLVACRSSESVELEVNELLSENDFAELGRLLSRFPDLAISLKDLTDRAWHLDFLQNFLQVRSLQLKCLWTLDSIEILGSLRELHHLELRSVLNGTSSLQPLRKLPKLKSMVVTGQWDELFYLGEIQSLEKLVISSLSAGDFGFIEKLLLLQELEVLDSALKDFSTFSSESVTRLRLANLRNLTDLDWLTQFPRLRELKLKSLPRLERLPSQDFLETLDLFKATHLRTAGIRNTVELQKREELLFTF